jgi:hypothetical protein
MGNFFPRWTNLLPFKILFAALLVGAGLTVAVATYWTKGYSAVGYQPDQPIPFDHSLHAGQLGMDCRYCHSHVERAGHANVPAAQTCWNCHQHVKPSSEKLLPLRAAMDPSYEGYTGKPVEWVRIHKLGDYAYFNHSVHVNRGVSCVSCHGKVNEMKVVWQHESQTMGWCLDCHRNPASVLRPLDQVTNLQWKPEDHDRDAFYAALARQAGRSAEELQAEAKAKGFDVAGPLTQKEVGSGLKEAWGVRPPESCSACHR